ncbi:MAG: glycosyltransferase [Bacteroidales bacterium]|jgi:glycosyltransferase involved in cell wall biosynthesis|nr:glycosyltransferase [Bacteroidales bacterium]
MNIKISVIIPIYNAEKYLGPTLDSIRFQSYKNLEIVCVLDCPTDSSAEIVDNIAKEDNRVKIIRNEQNMGLPKTRNIGVKNATGKYMHFIDSDDFISPGFYEVMINAAVDADADVAACSVFYEKKPKQSIWFERNEIVTDKDKIKTTKILFAGWSWRYLIKKSFWEQHEFSFPDLAPMEDTPVMIPMVFHANKIALCPDAIYYYKNREGSILNEESEANYLERKIEHKKIRLESRKIFMSFMRENKIKRPFVIYRRYRSFRTRRLVCVNDPVEYGKENKKISVIIPIYNAEKYLKETLDSIRYQTYKNLEIICVLDCPVDNSAMIVDEAAKIDNRLKIIRHQKNAGLPAARNAGVKNATGEYMHFMDADDLISPDFYEIMISAAVNANADVAACSVYYEKKPIKSIWFRNSEILSDKNDKIHKTSVAFQGWAWRYLIKKSFWDSNNLSFPDLVPMEDKPAMIPMIHHANKVVLCPSAVYFYKNREDSILNKNYDPIREKQRSANRRKARKLFKDFMQAHQIKRPNRLLHSMKRWFL